MCRHTLSYDMIPSDKCDALQVMVMGWLQLVGSIKS